MKRRKFLNSSLAASALVSSSNALALQTPENGAGQHEYYELRRYQLHSGPQPKMLDKFLAESLIPALNRMGMKPIGAFTLTLGPETPATYLLIPGNSLDVLVNSELRLAQDEEFMKKRRGLSRCTGKGTGVREGGKLAHEGVRRMAKAGAATGNRTEEPAHFSAAHL